MAKFIPALLTGAVLIGLGAAPADKGNKGDAKKRDPEQLFQKLDRNSDKFLTLAELNRKGKKDASTVEARFRKLDNNADQKVSLAEFKAAGKPKATTKKAGKAAKIKKNKKSKTRA